MAQVAATFTADISGYTSAMSRMVSSTNSATKSASSSALGGGKSFFKMGALAGAGATVVTKALHAMGSITTDVVSRFDTLNNANRTFKNMGFATSDTKKAMNGLNDSITGLPTSLDQAVQGMELMAASTGDVQEGQKVFSAVNDAVLGFGGSSAQASSAVQQLSQDLSSGTITAATWNSMINDGMGPALKAMAKSMGMTSGQLKDALSSGKVSADQFSDALINMDKNGGGGMQSLHKIAIDSTAGISSSLANLKTAVVRGAANMLTVVNTFIKSVTGTDISGWIKNAASAVTAGMAAVSQAIKSFTPTAQSIFNTLKSMVAWVSSNADWLGPLTAGIITFVAAVKTMQIITSVVGWIKGVITVISSLGGAIGALKSGWSGLMGLLGLGPWGIVIAAIVGVVAALVIFFTQTKTGKKIWSDFTTWLGTTWNNIVGTATDIWNGLTIFFVNLWAGIVNTATSMWSSFTSTISGIWSGIVGVATGIWTGISTFFTTLWTGISTVTITIWTTIVTFITTIWTSVVTIATTIFTPIASFFTTLWTGISTIATTLWTTITTSLTTIWTGIVTVATGIWNLLKAVIMAPILLLADFIDGQWNMISSDLNLIWTSIVSAGSTIWNGFVAILSGIWGVISGSAIGIWNAIGSALTTIWNTLKSVASSVWNGIKSVVTSTVQGAVSIAQSLWSGAVSLISGIWNGLKALASSTWNGIKSVVSSAINGTVSIARSLFSGLSSFMSGLWSSIRGAASSAWSGIRSTIQSIASGIVSGVRSAWSGFTSIASNVVSGIIGAFSALRSFDLGAAGRAVMNSFFSGLKDVWSSVKNFVSGIASWIRDHKGPVSYDAKLLIPAGNAIMNGLNSGLMNSFATVQSNVSGMADKLSDSINSVAGNIKTGDLSMQAASYQGGSIDQNIDTDNWVKPTYIVHNELVGDKIRTIVSQGEADDQVSSKFFMS